MSLSLRYAARSDIGLVRSSNQDSGYAGPNLLAMADGMGGHAGGDIASSLVIASLAQLDEDSIGASDATDALLGAIARGNKQIANQVDGNPDLTGMGTTLIAMLRTGGSFVLAHIGDSRAFLAREGRVAQVTRDHSYVQTLIDEGQITPEEASVHPQRSLVTRVLTGHAEDIPDFVVHQAAPGDRYLIASDGLTDFVSRDTIDDVILSDRHPDEVAEFLVDLSLRAGAPDNVTVVVGDVVEDELTPDRPEIVGAAAIHQPHTKPIPTTPAAKAAAISSEVAAASRPREASSAPAAVALDEEDHRERKSRVRRTTLVVLLTTVLTFAGLFGAYRWTQSRYFVGTEGGFVASFKGVPQSVGSQELSTRTKITAIRVTELPTYYRQRVEETIQASSQREADRIMLELQAQAEYCRKQLAKNLTCGQGAPNPSTSTTSPGPQISVDPSENLPDLPPSPPSGATTASP